MAVIRSVTLSRGDFMNVGFIGAGSMGAMLIRALVRGGAVTPAQVWVSNRSPQKLARLAGEVPGIHTADSARVVAECSMVFLCVKHGDTAAALDAMHAQLRPDQLLITLASVLPLPWLEERVPCRVAKVIPSLTQEVLKGPCLVIWGSRIRPPDAAMVRGLLERISLPVIIPEAQRRICADLASAAPAFLAWLLASMAEAATRFQPDLATEVASTLVREMAIGTAALLADQSVTFEEIVRRVATPGGMTEAGLGVLGRQMPGIWEQLYREMQNREAELAGKL